MFTLAVRVMVLYAILISSAVAHAGAILNLRGKTSFLLVPIDSVFLASNFCPNEGKGPVLTIQGQLERTEYKCEINQAGAEGHGLTLEHIQSVIMQASTSSKIDVHIYCGDTHLRDFDLKTPANLAVTDAKQSLAIATFIKK